MGVSKVVYGGNVLIDLTADTIKPDKVLVGYKAHGADGEEIIGQCDFDSNTQDATAADSEILVGKTAYVKGTKKTGIMPNNGAVTGTITAKDAMYTIPQGYHDGSGKVGISTVEQSKLVPENIRAGITILGVVGDMSGTEAVNPQSKTIVPSTEEQVVLPDSGYNYLSQVTVSPIPYVENENTAGGITITIG